MKPMPHLLCSLGAAFGLLLSACGGGGGGGSAAGTSDSSSIASATSSSGTISAFGSVFVNGHEFDTRNARVIDDDTGASTNSTDGLEVGMAVDVKTALHSTTEFPVADELHVHPLVRGVVDASDPTGGTLTVLGQSVQLTAATNFSDHRACLGAAASPCTAVAGQADLVVTTGSGGTAVSGSYVTVYGYLYAASASSGAANIVATLVSVRDTPTTTSGVNYKAEGLVTAVGSSAVTIGTLSVNLSSATCFASAGATACASAFSVGQIVSAYSSAAPASPATTLNASVARLRSKLPIETDGASIEFEGKVSSVASSAAAFVIRGVSVDASALTGSLPAVGDLVRVVGTVASGGTSVAASSVTVLHAALSATYGFEGDVGSVVAGSSPSTYMLTLLGQSIGVDASTRLADRSSRNGNSSGSSSNPFNITTFQSYLAASSSQHVIVRTQADASGQLSALSVTILPASTVSSVGGVVDATPAPANSSATGTPTTFSVHGLAVSADPASILKLRGSASHGGTSSATPTISAGDLVLVRGSFAQGTLTVTAPTGSLGGYARNIVIDAGTPTGKDRDCF